MNQDPEDRKTEPISDALKRKIESEIAKNKAEEVKLSLEAQEVEKRLRQKWYSGPVLIKWIVAGIITAALLTVWIKTQFEPILKLETQKDKLDNEISLLKLELEGKKINAKNDTLKEMLIKAQERTENIRAEYEFLRDAYDSLAHVKELLDKERAKYAELAKNAQKKIDSLNIEILQLRNSRRDIEILGQALESKGDNEYPENYDQAPVLIDSTVPPFPELAAKAGIEGTVWVEVLVDTNGIVRDARITKPSGTAVGFEEATLKHAYTLRFKPAISAGKPVAVWVAYPARFFYRDK
jgi:TonB family protein